LLLLLGMRTPLAISLLLVGCLDHGSDDTQAVQTSLEKTNGGLDTADEAPMFGAEAEFDDAAIEADTAVSDTMASDPTIVDMQNSPTAAAADLVVVWGRLPADPTALPHDWTGTLTISRGALLVHRTIAFEDATDRLLPREAANTVAFRSVTRPFVDGLALRVLDPTPAATDALTLVYTPANGGAAITIDLSQLANGPISIDAGGGDRIVAVGQHRDDVCHGGFMRGRWHALTANLGVFHGFVVDRDGSPIGHVRGMYGHRRNGDAVVFGKFIDRDGKFVGLIVGTYDSGELKARWIDRAGDHGAIHGKYFESTEIRGGGFVARWAETSCSEDR
jgi:hypothetical protein